MRWPLGCSESWNMCWLNRRRDMNGHFLLIIQLLLFFSKQPVIHRSFCLSPFFALKWGECAGEGNVKHRSGSLGLTFVLWGKQVGNGNPLFSLVTSSSAESGSSWLAICILSLLCCYGVVTLSVIFIRDVDRLSWLQWNPKQSYTCLSPLTLMELASSNSI